MALNGTVTAVDPTTFGVTVPGVVADGIVLSIGVADAVSITAEDCVKLETDGYVSPCTAKNDKIIGFASETKDNSSGANGDLITGVKVKGVAEQDSVTDTGSNTALTVGTDVYLSAAVASNIAVGQGLTAITSSATKVGKCLDRVAVPSSGTKVAKIRVLFDFTDNAIAWL